MHICEFRGTTEQLYKILIGINPHVPYGENTWSYLTPNILEDYVEGNHTVLVATIVNRATETITVIGYAFVTADGSHFSPFKDRANNKAKAYLSYLIVHPNAQRKGVGGALLSKVFQIAKRRLYLHTYHESEQHRWYLGQAEKLSAASKERVENETTYPDGRKAVMIKLKAVP